MYFAEEPVLETDDFSLLQYWRRRTSATPCAETDEFVVVAELTSGAHRLTLPRHGSTICQAERSFSALALLVSNLRKMMLPSKVEKTTFLKLNHNFMPEVRDHNKAVEAPTAKSAEAVKEVPAVPEKAAGHVVAIVM